MKTKIGVLLSALGVVLAIVFLIVAHTSSEPCVIAISFFAIFTCIMPIFAGINLMQEGMDDEDSDKE